MIAYDFGVGGYNLSFVMPELASGQWVGVKSNIGVTYDDIASPATSINTIRVGKDASGNYISILDRDNNLVERYTGFPNFGKVRIIFHNEFVTVYVDDAWIHTFGFGYIYHPEAPTIDLLASGNITITNIRLQELADWREAIFVDMETDSMNAISSVILQRPVDIRSSFDGALVFEYDPPRSTVTITDAKEHQYALTDSRQGCSDAITYFTKVAVTVDPKYAEQFGFVTRMYRFPDLDNGAIAASKIQQRRSREGSYLHSVRTRIRPELEVGDILRLQVTPDGGGAAIDKSFIVERITLQVGDGINATTIDGREHGV